MDALAYSRLMHAVIDNEQEMVTKILNGNPILLLRASKIDVQSKITGIWLQITNTPLELAFVRKQLNMVKLLLPYFIKLEKKGVIEDAQKKVLDQWLNIENILDKKKSEFKIQKNLTGYVRREDFSAASITLKLIERISEETREHLIEILKTIVTDAPIELDSYSDDSRWLNFALGYNENCIKFDDSNQRKLFCIIIFAFLANRQNAELVSEIYKKIEMYKTVIPLDLRIPSLCQSRESFSDLASNSFINLMSVIVDFEEECKEFCVFLVDLILNSNESFDEMKKGLVIGKWPIIEEMQEEDELRKRSRCIMQ